MNTKQILSPKTMAGIPEVSPEDFVPHLGKITLVDVRRPDEFTGDLSHIPGAQLVTLGPELDAFLTTHPKDDEIVFVCRSGGRSGQATLQSRSLGFTKTVNLQGGMLLWNQKRYPLDGDQ